VIVEVTPDKGARVVVAALPLPLPVTPLPSAVPLEAFQLDFALLVSLEEGIKKEGLLCQRAGWDLWMCRGEILLTSRPACRRCLLASLRASGRDAGVVEVVVWW
jgi:hypothetical protein